MDYPRLAIVDLETTGGDPKLDRITEVAILVTEGDQLISRWSSLVNPGMPIPPRIQAFTGITDDMVRDAPDFADVARQVAEQCDGAIFVAHNARFDYNFLHNAFARLEKNFEPSVLCTVKFSRALNPEHARHGLDAIILRGGYSVVSRHRAMDDAEIVWRFLQDSRIAHDTERMRLAWARAFSGPTKVARLPQGDVEGLPEGPGVFMLRGASGELIRIGRARSLRPQVLGLFTANDMRSKKQVAKVHAVDAQPCAGDLSAQLLELALERRLAARGATAALAWRLDADRAEGILELVDLNGSDPAAWGEVYGCFRGEREALMVLRPLIARARLCPRRAGLEKSGPGPCQAHLLKRCQGVCAGMESADAHDARLREVLAPLRQREWPFAGAISIHEESEANALQTTLGFDRWCRIDEDSTRRFDADIMHLLQRWLAQDGNLARCAVPGQD
ncbi:exonuclease domain-containing protein [Uliginosibacterium sp. H1]|uniref:exonuclease domain-containing protein n=1 Tax=Uliginosibacterium sp. H1 TaxID=3114757 RepID=UPI002E17B9AD|nr:exonuclease domain-containing protein [Uliginosibacterium sp. H1]